MRDTDWWAIAEAGHPVPSVGLIEGIDPQVVALCDALNARAGIQTLESCCGHGERPFNIYISAESLSDLAPVLYWFDECHCGFFDWRVEAGTDCGGTDVTFTIEGPAGAYDEADEIARLLLAGPASFADTDPETGEHLSPISMYFPIPEGSPTCPTCGEAYLEGFANFCSNGHPVTALGASLPRIGEVGPPEWGYGVG